MALGEGIREDEGLAEQVLDAREGSPCVQVRESSELDSCAGSGYGAGLSIVIIS